MVSSPSSTWGADPAIPPPSYLNPGPSSGCLEDGEEGAELPSDLQCDYTYINKNKTVFGPFQIITSFENIGLNLTINR